MKTFSLTATLAFSTLLTSAAWADRVVYYTSFEPPEYEATALNGQNGWTANASFLINEDPTVSAEGTQSVFQQSAGGDNEEQAYVQLPPTTGRRFRISLAAFLADADAPTPNWGIVSVAGPDGVRGEIIVQNNQAYLRVNGEIGSSAPIARNVFNYFELVVDDDTDVIWGILNGEVFATELLLDAEGIEFVGFGGHSGGGDDIAFFDDLFVEVEETVLYMPIGGSVGTFRTDMRIFNPSSVPALIAASFLPTGNNPNLTPLTVNITVQGREMKVLDDVVSTLFHATGLGSIRLTSSVPITATQRIYATVTDGTVGQFIPAFKEWESYYEGVIIHLKSNGSTGQKGTYRTNLIAINPNATANTTTWRLYDASNNLVATATHVLSPYGVLGPGNLNGNIFPGVTANLTDAWVSVTADEPIFAGGSVLDNGTTDSVFVPMVEDAGVYLGKGKSTRDRRAKR